MLPSVVFWGDIGGGESNGHIVFMNHRDIQTVGEYRIKTPEEALEEYRNGTHLCVVDYSGRKEPSPEDPLYKATIQYVKDQDGRYRPIYELAMTDANGLRYGVVVDAIL